MFINRITEGSIAANGINLVEPNLTHSFIAIIRLGRMWGRVTKKRYESAVGFDFGFRRKALPRGLDYDACSDSLLIHGKAISLALLEDLAASKSMQIRQEIDTVKRERRIIFGL